MGLRDLLARRDDAAPDPDAPLVLLVGHCGFDSGGLSRAARAALPGASIRRINDESSLRRALDDRPDALLLVNRRLDGRFPGLGGPDGVALIRALGPGPGPIRLLVSNYADAQAAALTAGARPGFGKSDLGTGRDTRAIGASVGAAERPD